MSFHNVRIDENIERGALGGPAFLTTVTVMGSGREQRNAEWQIARQKWNVGYGIMSQSEYAAVRSFFYVRRGRLHSWLFKDWTDYSRIDEPLGLGDSADAGVTGNRDFQLIVTYADTAGSYIRPISRPVTGSLTVYVDGVLATEWTLQPLGLIRFNSGHAPTTGQVVSATFEFDIPVRFDADLLGLEVEWVGAGSVPQLNIVEQIEIESL